MQPEVEKIMVFKAQDELPAYLRRLGSYCPNFGAKVIVVEQQPGGFLRVQFTSEGGEQKKAVLSTSYFRTVRKQLLRERLMSQDRTPAIEAILKKI